MIEYYKTSHEVAADGTKVPFTGRVDAPVRGCWISVVAPTQEERRWMLEELPRSTTRRRRAWTWTQRPGRRS